MKIDLTKRFTDRNEFIRYVTKGSNEVVEKNDLITALCKNKQVLDLGCIDHSALTAINLGSTWLHKQIKDVAEMVIGIDILKDEASILNEHGYKIICSDVENFNLDRTFDVIVAGDIIEHVSNIGLFLENAKKHMHDNSIFIITTPNPFNIEQTMAAIFDNTIYVNEQHTTWISPHNFWELTSRFSLSIVGFYWINTRFHLATTRPFYKTFANRLSSFIMKKRNLCQRDFAIVLKKN